MEMAMETLFLSTSLVFISPQSNSTIYQKTWALVYSSEQYHGFQINLFYEVAPTLRLKPAC